MTCKNCSVNQTQSRFLVKMCSGFYHWFLLTHICNWETTRVRLDVDIGDPGIELVPMPNQASIGNEQKYQICCLDVDEFCIWNRETHGMPIPVWMHTSRNSLSSSQSPLQHQQRGKARPRWRPGGARPRWRSPATGELDLPVMEGGSSTPPAPWRSLT